MVGSLDRFFATLSQFASEHGTLLEWLAASGTLLAGLATLFAFWAAWRAGSIAKQMANLEVKPHLMIELIDGEMFRISEDGLVLKKGPDGLVEQPMMCRIVNAGRTAATSTRLCRVLELVPVEPGGRGSPSQIDLSKVNDLEENCENGTYTWCKTTKFTSAANSKSAPISANVSTESIAKVKDKLFNNNTWVYLHGFIEFENSESKERARSGFCFLYVPQHKHLGFFVSLDSEHSWYYKKLAHERT